MSKDPHSIFEKIIQYKRYSENYYDIENFEKTCKKLLDSKPKEFGDAMSEFLSFLARIHIGNPFVKDGKTLEFYISFDPQLARSFINTTARSLKLPETFKEQTNYVRPDQLSIELFQSVLMFWENQFNGAVRFKLPHEYQPHDKLLPFNTIFFVNQPQLSQSHNHYDHFSQVRFLIPSEEFNYLTSGVISMTEGLINKKALDILHKRFFDLFSNQIAKYFVGGPNFSHDTMKALLRKNVTSVLNNPLSHDEFFDCLNGTLSGKETMRFKLDKKLLLKCYEQTSATRIEKFDKHCLGVVYANSRYLHRDVDKLAKDYYKDLAKEEPSDNQRVGSLGDVAGIIALLMLITLVFAPNVVKACIRPFRKLAPEENLPQTKHISNNRAKSRNYHEGKKDNKVLQNKPSSYIDNLEMRSLEVLYKNKAVNQLQ